MTGKTGTIAVVIAIMLALLAGTGIAAEDEAARDAVSAAERWLALVDRGDYAESWEQAAARFKAAVTQDQWVQTVQPVREQLGTIISRKISTKTVRPAVSDAWGRKSIVIRFLTDFPNLHGADEVVTLVLAKDGQWKTTEYWINPGSPDRQNIIMALVLFLTVIALLFMEMKFP
jgi:hypothetical protein